MQSAFGSWQVEQDPRSYTAAISDYRGGSGDLVDLTLLSAQASCCLCQLPWAVIALASPYAGKQPT